MSLQTVERGYDNEANYGLNEDMMRTGGGGGGSSSGGGSSTNRSRSSTTGRGGSTSTTTRRGPEGTNIDDLDIEIYNDGGNNDTGSIDNVTITSDDGGIIVAKIMHSLLDYTDGTSLEAYLVGPINWSTNESFSTCVNVLYKLFNFDNISLAQTFANAYKNNSEGITVFINNVSFTEFLKNKDVLEKLNTNVSLIPRSDENDWDVKVNNVTIFTVRFARGYIFENNERTAQKNIQYTLINYKGKEDGEDALINIRFNIINEPLSVDISYTDVQDFIWFKVSAYYKIKAIAVRLHGETDKTYCIYNASDNSLRADVNYDNNLLNETNKDNWKIIHQLSSLNYNANSNTIGYNGNAGDNIAPIININSKYLTDINSEFFLSESTVLQKTTTEIKAYVPGLLKDNFEYKDIDVFIQFSDEANKRITTSEAITEANAFRAFANTHCKLDYLSNEFKLHDNYKPTKAAELIAIFKLNNGETSFNGNISVFYGNQIMYNENYSTEGITDFTQASLVTTNNEKYDSNKVSLYYTLKKTEDLLYVYIKKTKDDNFWLNKFVSIYLSDYGDESYYENNYSTQYISQDNITLHSIDVSVPQVSKGDTLVYIDESFTGKTHHYTNISNINVGNTYAYYGVRAYAYIGEESTYYFDNDIYLLGINGLTYNVNAQIVKLNPYKEQQNIYAFTNGEEYLLLNKDAVNIKVSGTSVIGYDLCNGENTLSYEYIIDGNPKRPKYLSSYAHVDYTTKNARYDDHDAFTIAYYYEDSVNKVLNPIAVSTNYRFNINDIYASNEEENIYAYKFYKYTENEEFEEDNIYKKVEEYVQIPAGSISLNDFKEIVKRAEKLDEEELLENYPQYGENKFYNYTSTNKKYTPYKYSEIKNYKSVPLNLYAKDVYFIKTSEIIPETYDETIERYKRNIDFIPISSDDKDVNKKYYQKINDNTYILIRDISNYYGYKLCPISEYEGDNNVTLNNTLCEDYFNEIQNNLSPEYRYDRIRIKSTYTSIMNYIDEGILSVYDFKNYQLYEKIDNISFVDITNDGNINKDILTIYDIDLTGHTLYSSTNKIDGIISLDDIQYALNRISGDNNGYYPTQEEILKDIDGYSKYTLDNFDIGDGKKIKYIVSLTGIYSPIKFNNLIIEDGKPKTGAGENNWAICIKSDIPSFKTVQYDLYDKLSELRTYKLDDILYIPLFKKLSYDDLDNPLYSDYIFYKYNDTYYHVNYVDNILDGEDISSQLYIKDYEQPKRIYDIYASIHKQYFRYSNKIISGRIELYSNISHDVVFDPYPPKEYDPETETYNRGPKITVPNDFYSILSDIPFSSNDKEKEKQLNEILDFDSIVLYKSGISYYTLGGDSFAYEDSINNVVVDENYKEKVTVNTLNENLPTDDIFIKTKFFYSTYTFNDGIHVDSNGSYYTNIMGFDSESGKTSKRLYLNNHIINVDRYSYTIQTAEYMPVTLTQLENLNVSNYDYSKYYIQYKVDDELITENLNASSQPLAYWVTNSDAKLSYSLLQKVYTENTFKYDGVDTHQLTDNLGKPVVIKMNNSFYGLIFNNDLKDDSYTYSKFITFDKGYDTVTNGFLADYFSDNIDVFTEFDAGDDTISEEDIQERLNNINSNNEVTVDDIKNALITANNELYYNNYKDTEAKNCYLYNATIDETKYLYEIVPLSLFTFRNYNSDNSLLQYKDIITHSIVTPKPFTISNPNEVKFTGTYTWVPPEYTTVISDEGVKKLTISKDGYWKKDYVTEEKPLKISSYNFYPKDEISSINITYNFIPNSYVVTAEINHPSISYDCLIGEIKEEIKYSYLVNGFEYDYNEFNGVSFENGAYYGQVNLLDINDTYTSVKVRLYKKNTIINSSYVKKVEVQPVHTTYEYFTYKEATPLANEKVPVLYKTELIPAKKSKVQYWDKLNNSYAIKTVISSYAYYSYSYTYETIPLQVASYIYSSDLNIGNFPVLGEYISNIGYSLSGQVGEQAYAVRTLSYDLNKLVSYDIVQERNIATEKNQLFSTYSNLINNSINNLNVQTNESLSYLSTDVSRKINTLTEVEEKTISSLEKNVVSKITEQHNIIKEGLNNVNDTLNIKFKSLENRLHDDTIGAASKQEKKTTWESTTYSPIIEDRSGLVSGYSYSKKTGSQTIEIGGDSLGEILQSTLGTTSTYTVTNVNEDGSYTVSTYEGFNGIANILANLEISNKIPNYNEFMVDLVPKMFASVDFEGDYNIVYDVNGNVKHKEKRNPTDIAKKCIMRADILWNELKKKNIVH